jgi:D-amino peptidase
MEGMPGTWSFEQEKSDRSIVRKAINNHVKDVLEAMLASSDSKKITEIIIADDHGMCNSVDYELTLLDKRISLISGSPRSHYMMSALDTNIDAVFFLGYHAGSGTINASMDHTYSSSRIHSIWINDRLMNETLINAAFAGHYNIPVLLITGDLALYEELRQTELAKAEFVITKEALARFSAKNYSLLKVREETKLKVELALKKIRERNEVFSFSSPITLKALFSTTSIADAVSVIPSARRIDGRTVIFGADNFKTIMDALTTFTTVAYSVTP